MNDNRYYFDLGYEVMRYDRHRFVFTRENETIKDAMIRVNQERIADQKRILNELKNRGFLIVTTKKNRYIVTEDNIDHFL